MMNLTSTRHLSDTMQTATGHRLMQRARRLLARCLLLALPLYGVSLGVVDMLGVNHTHVQSARAADAMRGWQDFRRAGRVPETLAGAHGHSHAVIARHHHEPGDASVVALDGAASDDDAAAGDGGSPSSGSVSLGLVSGARVLPPVQVGARWADAAEALPHGCDGARLERPPRLA